MSEKPGTSRQVTQVVINAPIQNVWDTLTEQGKILPKRTTKVTARFQRQLGTAVKRARYLALLPYIRDHQA